MNDGELSLYTRTFDHDLETELEFIALLIGFGDFLPDAMEIVNPSDMYYPYLREIYAYMIDLYHENNGYIAEEILNHIKDEEIASQVRQSITTVITYGLKGVTARADVIKKYSILRSAVTAVQPLLTADKETVIDDIETTVQSLSDLTMQSQKKDLVLIADRIIEYGKKKHSGKNENVIPTKWEKLDRNVRMCRGDVVIIAARPSVGKSAFALNLSAKFVFQGYRTSLFSLEMTETQIFDRLHACVGQVPLNLLINNQLEVNTKEDDDFGRAQAMLYTKPLHIDDSSFETVQEIKRKCRKYKSSVVIIDYLQLITSTLGKKNASRAEEVSEMTRQLKIMAGELNALVIVLSQLNRSVESRAIQRPMLSDLRESGSIEQDANSILFLSLVNPEDKENSDILVDIAKNRDGAVGCAVFSFDRTTQTMRETDKRYEPPATTKKKDNFRY